MKRTINEIYEIIKLHKDELLNLLDKNIKDTRDKVFNDIETNSDIDMNDYSNLLQEGDLLRVKIDLYTDILNIIEESGVLEEERLKDMALKLACKRIDCLMGNEDSEYVTDPFTFELLAKEEQEKGETRC